MSDFIPHGNYLEPTELLISLDLSTRTWFRLTVESDPAEF